MPFTVRLTDDDDGIEIVKSGAPHLSAAMLWLARECKGSYQFRCDGVFTLFFEFENENDAQRFEAAWKQHYR